MMSEVKKATRDGFGEEIVTLGKQNKDICVIDIDIGKSCKTGEFVKEVRTEWGTFNVSCFAKVPGNSLEDTKGGLSIIRGYGQILGKLHSLMKDYPCSEKHRSHEDLLKEIGTRIKEYDAPEKVEQ